MAATSRNNFGKAMLFIFVAAVFISVLVNASVFYYYPERAVQLIDYFHLPPIYLPKFTCDSQCNNFSESKTIALYKTDIICQPDLYLLIAVTSSTTDKHRRSKIRQTWAATVINSAVTSKKVKVLFFVGTSRSTRQHLEGYYSDVEMERYQDLVLLDVTDTYQNLTRKTALIFQWIASFCRTAKYVMKTDDDTFNVPENIVKFLDKQTEQSDFIAGQCASGIRPYRDPRNKWYVSESHYSASFYPLYLRGRGYILPQRIVSKLLSVSDFVLYNPMEDVFWTGICRVRAAIPTACVEGYVTKDDRHRLHMCEVTDDIINVHHVTPEEMQLYWDMMYKNRTAIQNTCRARDQNRTSITIWILSVGFVLVICCVWCRQKHCGTGYTQLLFTTTAVLFKTTGK